MDETTTQATATDLDRFHAETVSSPDRYWLGRYVQTHQLGDYAFVEYIPWTVRNGSILRGQIDDPTARSFTIYIQGKRIGFGADTLETAMVVALAYRYDGPNSRAAGYFAKMIGLPTA